MSIMEKIESIVPFRTPNEVSYISKGLCRQQLRDGRMIMESRGEEYVLDAALAKVWLAGKTGTGRAGDTGNIRQLETMNLVEVTSCRNDVLDTYRLLTRCVICPTEDVLPFAPKETRQTLRWIRHAGIRLTMAELVRLMELQLEPEPQYLGRDNRQTLVEAIYCADNIEDGMLENLMEHSKAMVTATDHVLTLLRAGHVRLL